jgi:hypothetical protein
LLLVSLLVVLHIVEGLQHCLHQLVLGGDQLFKVNIVVGVVVVVVAGLAIALAIPCVHHLMVLVKRESEIPHNPTICTRDRGKIAAILLS